MSIRIGYVTVAVASLVFLMSHDSLKAADDASPAERFQQKEFVGEDGSKHKYRVFVPSGFEDDKAKTYPLVLFLHGAGERGDDNTIQLKHGAPEFASAARQAQYPCIVIAPQCPHDEKWVSVDWSPASGKGTFSDEPSPAMQGALGIVNQWIEGGRVDRSRVYITGLSMGGYGTWYASAMKDNPFAAAMPICGGGDPTWAARYASMPIWTFHGTNDQAVPVIRSQEMMAALKEAGQKPEPKYTEYEGGDHDVWTETYKRDDAFAWLFNQKK